MTNNPYTKCDYFNCRNETYFIKLGALRFLLSGLIFMHFPTDFRLVCKYFIVPTYVHLVVCPFTCRPPLHSAPIGHNPPLNKSSTLNFALLPLFVASFND